MGNMGSRGLCGRGRQGRVLRSQKAKGKIKRNFKRQQMISTINDVEKFIQLRTELYPQYLTAWVELATILGQLMQVAITNKSLSDRGLYSGHLLLSLRMVQSRCSWLAWSFSYSETRFLPSFGLTLPWGIQLVILEKGMSRHNCFLSSFTQKLQLSLLLTSSCQRMQGPMSVQGSQKVQSMDSQLLWKGKHK